MNLSGRTPSKNFHAEGMVKKGMAFLMAGGPEKGYAEITSKTSQFKDRDLYLVACGLDGMVHAHGADGKMVGKNLIDLKDAARRRPLSRIVGDRS